MKKNYLFYLLFILAIILVPNVNAEDIEYNKYYSIDWTKAAGEDAYFDEKLIDDSIYVLSNKKITIFSNDGSVTTKSYNLDFSNEECSYDWCPQEITNAEDGFFTDDGFIVFDSGYYIAVKYNMNFELEYMIGITPYTVKDGSSFGINIDFIREDDDYIYFIDFTDRYRVYILDKSYLKDMGDYKYYSYWYFRNYYYLDDLEETEKKEVLGEYYVWDYIMNNIPYAAPMISEYSNGKYSAGYLDYETMSFKALILDDTTGETVTKDITGKSFFSVVLDTDSFYIIDNYTDECEDEECKISKLTQYDYSGNELLTDYVKSSDSTFMGTSFGYKTSDGIIIPSGVRKDGETAYTTSYIKLVLNKEEKQEEVKTIVADVSEENPNTKVGLSIIVSSIIFLVTITTITILKKKKTRRYC